VTPEARLDRDQLAICLDAAGIDAVAYYPKLVHDYPCYRGHPQVAADATSRAALGAQQVLSLPVHPGLTGADISRVVTCVRETWSNELAGGGAETRATAHAPAGPRDIAVGPSAPAKWATPACPAQCHGEDRHGRRQGNQVEDHERGGSGPPR
jgi:hypothetical protein